MNTEALHAEYLQARDGWLNRSNSLASEMQSICDEIKARNRAKAAAAPVQRQPASRDLAQVRAEYEREKSGFDSAYIFSDDYAYFTRQNAKFMRICALSDEIEKLVKMTTEKLNDD